MPPPERRAAPRSMTRRPSSKPKAAVPRLALDGGVWVTADGENLGGPARMALLRAVGELGSITHAARAVGLSYKGAWDAVEAMNRLAGEALVERSAGGRGGGSTRLTEHGRRLVERFERIDALHRRVLATLDREAFFDLSADFSLTRLLSMQTSARNQFVGSVVALRAGAVNDEVEIQVPDGPRIAAVVTRESTHRLGLRPGMTAIALVKASSVLVATGLDGARLSARNAFDGVVAAVRPGAVNAEVQLDLDGGGGVTAVVTGESVQSLGLAPGVRATAFFKASSVIVATID